MDGHVAIITDLRRAGFNFDEIEAYVGVPASTAARWARLGGAPICVDPRRVIGELWPRRDEPEVREVLRDFLVARSRLVVGENALSPDEVDLLLDGVELAAAS